MEVDQSHSHSSHHGHKHKDQPSYLSSQHRLSRDKAEGKWEYIPPNDVKKERHQLSMSYFYKKWLSDCYFSTIT